MELTSDVGATDDEFRYRTKELGSKGLYTEAHRVHPKIGCDEHMPLFDSSVGSSRERVDVVQLRCVRISATSASADTLTMVEHVLSLALKPSAGEPVAQVLNSHG